MYQFATRGKSEGEIWYPAGVCCSRNGDIYVADHGNHRVQVSVAIEKKSDYSTHQGTALALYYPTNSFCWTFLATLCRHVKMAVICQS